MANWTDPPIYQVHLWIRQISPMIWRRVLIRSDSTLAQFHDIIQIVFGWSDSHLHRFRVHGRHYGVSRDGGLGSSQDARQVRLVDFQFRHNERFLYEYDFGDRWQHEVRIERGLEDQPKRAYPVCVGGQRAAPPEDCGGPWAFLVRRDAVSVDVVEHLGRLVESVDAGDLDAIRDQSEEIESLREWLDLDRFDRRHVNRRLRQYAAGDEDWRWT
jgi:Plasmid pRiA4b ORF-3-like protein